MSAAKQLEPRGSEINLRAGEVGLNWQLSTDQIDINIYYNREDTNNKSNAISTILILQYYNISKLFIPISKYFL